MAGKVTVAVSAAMPSRFGARRRRREELGPRRLEWIAPSCHPLGAAFLRRRQPSLESQSILTILRYHGGEQGRPRLAFFDPRTRRTQGISRMSSKTKREDRWSPSIRSADAYLEFYRLKRRRKLASAIKPIPSSPMDAGSGTLPDGWNAATVCVPPSIMDAFPMVQLVASVLMTST
jgi:hypothetical protein